MSAFRAMYYTIWDGLAKYRADAWEGMPTDLHLQHAKAHIQSYLQGDRSEDHLGHALVRLFFAIETRSDEDAPPDASHGHSG